MISGCYAMPSGDVIKEYPVSTAAGFLDPINFCQTQCATKKYHYYSLKVNKTCQCIDKVPLGGKKHYFVQLGSKYKFCTQEQLWATKKSTVEGHRKV